MSDLTWEISYLEKNEKPRDSYGRDLDIISAGSSNLKDKDIQKLAQALEKNSVFQGGINLQENHLTDLSVLYLTDSLQRSQCQVNFLDLSFNNLKEKSGIYIGNLLGTGYKMRELALHGCCVEIIGVQRIFEKLVDNSFVKSLDIGILHSSGLQVMSKYLPSIRKLKRISFQQGDLWTDNAKKEFINAIRENYLLSINIINCDNNEFVDEVLGIEDRNKMLYSQQKDEKAQENFLNPTVFAEEIQSFIENSIQNLPVRVYLTNSLGTLLNDGIYQLMKFRFKENDPSKNTAVNNIKWLVRYILDRSRS